MTKPDRSTTADAADRGAASDAAALSAPPSGRALAQDWLNAFGRAVAAGDAPAIGNLFHADGYWRDFLALHWDLRTFSGSERIAGAWQEALRRHRISAIRLEDGNLAVFERKDWGRTVEAFFTFETETGRCRGHLRLLERDGKWRGWTLFTSLEELKGHEERAGPHRSRSRRSHDAAVAARGGARAADDPQVLVIGAGQAGLAVAARLQQQDIATIVIDRDARVGDVWRNRYQSLLLHNQIWANHLPYLPFPSSWPAYLSKEEMADWLEIYARALDLHVWLATSLVDAVYDEGARRWTVRLARADGTITVVHPSHVIQATGVFGVPNRPAIPGADTFTGTLIHASEYKGGIAGPGKRVLVVGTGSSGHDVAQDLCKQGAEVTMLQRSSTCVVSVEPGAARAYSIYREDGPPLEDADFVSNSLPFPLLTELHKELTRRIAEMDRDLLRGLADAGFALDFGEDGSGFLMKYHRYGGGYYINAGCSELIIEGRIKVRQGTGIERLDGRTVRFADGTAMDVDAVVIAAGYTNMSESVRAIIGAAVADRVGPIWGLDDEGEVRAMWRPTGQPGFWLMGGSLQQCRPYSKYLALQIKAAEAGLVPARSDAA